MLSFIRLSSATLILLSSILTSAYVINRKSAYDVRYTCNSICTGQYDLCLTMIRTRVEQLLCIKVTMKCKVNCHMSRLHISTTAQPSTLSTTTTTTTIMPETTTTLPTTTIKTTVEPETTIASTTTTVDQNYLELEEKNKRLIQSFNNHVKKYKTQSRNVPKLKSKMEQANRLSFKRYTMPSMFRRSFTITGP